MCANLLSPVHIQKLGHPIEEIRVRALHAILSKYNLELVDNKNYENSRLLLEKLFNWFNFEKHPYEEKVFTLIIKILKEENTDFILEHSNKAEILKKIDLIQKCVDLKFIPFLHEIKECIADIEKKLLQPNAEMKQPLFDSKLYDSVGDHFLLNKKNYELINTCIAYNSNDSSTTVSIEKFKEQDEFSNENGENEIMPSVRNSSNKFKNKMKDEDEVDKFLHNNEKVNFNNITEYFSWQPLVQGDNLVLASVYEGLRYIDNTNSIVHSCHFFNDVLLKDFPAEIFVQRPLIIQTFLELLQSEVSSIQISVLVCVIATVKQLHYQLKNFASNINLIHSKQEFYDGFMFKNKPIINDNISQTDKLEEEIVCNCSSESDLELETNGEVLSIKSQQLSLSQFCFSVLSHTIPHLSKKKSVEEMNLIFELILEIFSLMFSMIPNIKSNNSFKKNLYRIFNLFHDPLIYNKKRNRMNHSIIVYIIIMILNSLKISELEEVLPHCIQFQLIECISDYIFILLFPNAHSKILNFARHFLGQRKKELIEDFEVFLKIRQSMKSAVQFMKNFNNLKNRKEKLNQAQEALLCLEFHKNYKFITDFVNNCLLKWGEKQLKENQIEIRRNIILKLLSHQDEGVKFNMYREIHFHVIKHLGVEEAMKPEFIFPGDKFNFLFDSNILSEIICHGLSSSEVKIQEFSSEILIHILKGKFLFSCDFWQIFIAALVPTLPLLQCYADKTTALGRCIIKMLDPDISKAISLSPCDVIRGNLRLLFSKEHLIREEALSRLFWLLTKEDPDKQKLPRLNLLGGINLSSICSSVTPEQYSRMNQKFYSASNLSNVLEMLCADSIEPSVRRSALSQISVMLDDIHLHSSFLEENGLQSILNIFKNCLVEKEFKNYPDSVVPIMNILKLLCLYNPNVRLQLSQDIDLYYCLLRSLLLFNSERKSRQNGVELLCLLLYNECIINIQDERAIQCRISLPQVVVTKICLPFLTHIHSKYSKHTEPSIRGIMLNEKMAKLLRICWYIEWFGNISQVLSMEYDDLKEKIFSPNSPKDMIIKYEDLRSLKNNSIEFSIQKRMYDIQNATTHEDVILSLHSLKSSLLLYDLNKYLDEDECYANHLKNITASLLKLPWESTFKRYLLIKPSSEDDDILLYQIIRVVRFVLKIFKSENLISWIVKLLTNEIESLPNIIKSYGKRNSGLMRRDLTRAVIELIKEIVKNTECSNKTLFSYIVLIVEELKLNGRNDSYNIAYIDWLISLLADLTGKPLFNIIDKAEFYETVITSTMDVMVSLYCSKDSQNSFLGVNTIRNCLYIFNHILDDMHLRIKDWEQLWYHALSQVIGHKEQPNYSWLLSLWYVRDPIIRALTIQLLTGFCLTCRACELLMEQLHIKFEYVWNEGFKLFFDNDECNLVREKAALLLSNLTYHGSIKTASEFLKHLTEIHFYEKLLNLFESLHLEPTLYIVKDTSVLNLCHKDSWDNSSALFLSSPSLISAVNILLLNVMFLDPLNVSIMVLKIGILEILIRILNHAPEICEKYKDEEYVLEIIKMYTTTCTLLTKCVISNSDALTFTQQSEQFIASLYCLLNFKLFNESKVITDLRNKLWSRTLDLLSVLLTEPEVIVDKGFIQDESFKALNQAMTENGTDYFISSLYLAITSNSCDLRLRCIHFLNNLFVHEANKSSNISILDIIDRNIFPESATIAEQFSWNGYSISKMSDLNFGKRICDSLLQTYNVCNHIENLEFKKSVPITLGSFLAISENAQNYCIELGLAKEIIASLKTAFIKLSLENIENLNKVSDKKRIDPVLSEIETSYKLMSNLFSGNQKIKSYFADLGLSSLVHKLWYWCLARDSLLTATLKMLCTFTLNSISASRTLAISKTWTSVGLRKSSSSTTLLNSVIELIEKEMDLISKTQELRTLRLLFQLLENCCSISECRCAISKSALLRSFKSLYSGVVWKKRIQNEDLTELWFNFFTVFTAHQEGLLTLIKDEDVLDEIICAASIKSSRRYKALKILRNLCFHQLNKIQLLSHYPFLSVILQILKSDDTEDIDLVLQSIWALTCNSQKGKSIIRNAGIEELVGETKKKLQLNHSFSSLALADIVLRTLKNK